MSTQVDSIAMLVADVEYFIQVCGQILISDEVPREHFIHMHGLSLRGQYSVRGDDFRFSPPIHGLENLFAPRKGQRPA
jgi:hypothetical protein